MKAEKLDLIFVNDSEPALNAANMNAIVDAVNNANETISKVLPADDYIELTERAMAAADKAEEEAAKAETIVGIGIATTSKAGIVKPDGTTIDVDTDGTIHCINGGPAADYDAELSTTSENAPQNKAVTNALDNINVYVGESDGKLHFVDRTGADSVLNFSGGGILDAFIPSGYYWDGMRDASVALASNAAILSNTYGVSAIINIKGLGYTSCTLTNFASTRKITLLKKDGTSVSGGTANTITLDSTVEYVLASTSSNSARAAKITFS